jgi:hypothetical protein
MGDGPWSGPWQEIDYRLGQEMDHGAGQEMDYRAGRRWTMKQARRWTTEWATGRGWTTGDRPQIMPGGSRPGEEPSGKGREIP